MDFDVKTERWTDGCYAILLAGEVDMYTAPEFKKAFQAALKDGAREIVVDLSESTFIDSIFLGVLLGGMKRLGKRDGTLSIVCSDRNLRKIFEITGLDRVFKIYLTSQEAGRPEWATPVDAAGSLGSESQI